MDDEELLMWIERLKADDPRAPQAIWKALHGRILRYAKRRLSGVKRRVLDEEDVALSAFNSFFRAVSEDRVPKLDDKEDLTRFLITLTTRKATAARRKLGRQKRGGGKVRGESYFEANDNSDFGLADVHGTEETPALAAELCESYQILMDRLDDPLLKQVAQLKMEGYTNEQIAEQLDCVTRTVERKLARIRKKWEVDEQSSQGSNDG